MYHQQEMRFGAADAFNSMLFGEVNPQTKQWLERQIQEALPLFVNGGQEFIQSSMDYFNHYNGEAALRFARSVNMRQAETAELPRISVYNTVEQFQRASPLMQRFIMANPSLRTAYVNQRIDGYSETYIDLDPGQTNWHQYDYRRATEGLMQIDESEEGDGRWEVAHYHGDELREGDRALLIEEQIDIQRTWSNYDLLQALTKDDLTSSSGGQL